jgi:hypothetical protein
VPTSLAKAPEGPIKALYQLGALLGKPAILAALTFVAYLLGSMLRWQGLTKLGALLADMLTGGPPWWKQFIPYLRLRSANMSLQLRTFLSPRLGEGRNILSLDDHVTILSDYVGIHGLEWDDVQWEYMQAIIQDLEAVGIQLQAKNRDFWDTYDREMAEAQFRYGIVLPLVLIITLFAIGSSWWWLLLLAAPLLLIYRGIQHSLRPTSTLVQAIVLKMVEPPVLERLREAIAKKQEAAKEEAEKTRS